MIGAVVCIRKLETKNVFFLVFLKVRFWIMIQLQTIHAVYENICTDFYPDLLPTMLLLLLLFPYSPLFSFLPIQPNNRFAKTNPSPKKNPSVSRISRKCTWMMPKTRCWVDFEHNWALWSERGAEAANFWIVREFLDLKGRWKFVVFFCFLSLKTHHSFFAVKNKLGMAEFLIFHFYFWMVFIGGEKMIQHFFLGVIKIGSKL